MDATETPETHRFSESPLWDWQRQYFEKQGIKAWQLHEVPHHITCSNIIAKGYAETVFAFIRERARLQPQNTETVYLLEPGAGSGKLAFRFLKYLEELYTQSGMQLPAYCYVLSDFTRANADFWKTHPQLQPFFDAGVLDIALFDAVHDTELHLECSGKKITKGCLSQPLVIIANYFFDSIPQDLFYISNGKLHEMRVRFEMPEKKNTQDVSALPSGMQITYSVQPAVAAFYSETEFNTLLHHYVGVLEETHLFFPHAAIRCLQNLEVLSREGFVLLSADKGDHREELLDHNDLPLPDRHGSFSFSVNYHAIKNIFEARGAESLNSAFNYSYLNICAIFTFPEAHLYLETSGTFRRQLLEKSPDDYHNLQKFFLNQIAQASVTQLLSYLKINGYDADLLERSISRLIQLAGEMPATEKESMLEVITQTWQRYYPIGERYDLAFQIGVLLFLAELPDKALPYFKISGQVYGENALLLYNIASCYFQLGQFPEALYYAEKTIALEPLHEGANYILSELQAQESADKNDS